MADKTDDIRQEIKKSRQDIEDTRSGMTEKLATLEERVEETVETVKHTFDVHYQVKQRPWLMVGGSLLVGYMLGSRAGVSSTTHTSSEWSSRSQPHLGTAADGRNHFKSEIAIIKNAAFGAVINTLWTMAKQVLLPPAQQIDRVITKSGAQPIDSPEQMTNRVITSNTNGRSEV